MPRILTLSLALIAGATPGFAQQTQPLSAVQTRPVANAGASQPAIPDEYRLNLMVRGTVVALSQANMTGNYSVLRDLGTPGFQVANNPSRLSEIFAPLRSRKLDLTPIMFFNPKLLGQPALQDGQVLRITGFFPTTPEQVNFDLAFQVFGGQWMLAGIAVSTAPPEPQKAAQTSSLQSPPMTPRGPGEAPAEAKPSPAEAKPVRIDLSEPAPVPPPTKKPPAPKKPKPVVATAPAATPGDPSAPRPSTATMTEEKPSAAPRPASPSPDDWLTR